MRYHLKEYSVRPPKNAKELFNLRHASLHTAIERAFGVLKKRFPIIASTTNPNYCVDTQNEIILACCILHNYLMVSILMKVLLLKLMKRFCILIVIVWPLLQEKMIRMLGKEIL